MPLDRSCLSIIIPVYNEEANLPELRRRVAACAREAMFDDVQVLLISDGSQDRTDALIADIVREDPTFTGLILTRNFGHQAAVSIGMEHARGSVIAIIDGDLQDPPEAINLLVEALAGDDTTGNDGADVAFGVRASRKENLFKRSAYFAFYRILRSVSATDIPLDTGDFCAMRRCVVDDMLRLPERNRFVRGLRAWVGYKQVGVPYARAARHAGAPKYTFKKLCALAYDGLFSFSSLPVRIMQVLGFAISALAFFTAIIYFTIALITRHPDWQPGWPTLIISIWFLGGVQLLFLGLVGEYVHRTFDEARKRPVALVRQVLTSAPAHNPQPAQEGQACKANTPESTPSYTVVIGGGARANAS